MFKFSRSTQLDYIKTIIDKLNNLTDSFPKELNKLKPKANIEEAQYSSIDINNLTMFLLFGISKTNEASSKKIDYNKNKNLLKTLICSTGSFTDSVLFLRETIKLLDDTMTNIQDVYVKMNPSDLSDKPENKVLNTSDYGRLYDIINSFASEVSSFRNKAFTLDTLCRNANFAMEYPEINPHFKYDTLKRFYFSHVYELKNNVMVFDKNVMLFGEIDNIMRNFDNLFNFLFGDFICIYQTLINQMTHIYNSYNSSTK